MRMKRQVSLIPAVSGVRSGGSDYRLEGAAGNR